MAVCIQFSVSVSICVRLEYIDREYVNSSNKNIYISQKILVLQESHGIIWTGKRIKDSPSVKLYYIFKLYKTTFRQIQMEVAQNTDLYPQKPLNFILSFNTVHIFPALRNKAASSSQPLKNKKTKRSLRLLHNTVLLFFYIVIWTWIRSKTQILVYKYCNVALKTTHIHIINIVESNYLLTRMLL